MGTADGRPGTVHDGVSLYFGLAGAISADSIGALLILHCDGISVFDRFTGKNHWNACVWFLASFLYEVAQKMSPYFSLSVTFHRNPFKTF